MPRVLSFHNNVQFNLALTVLKNFMSPTQPAPKKKLTQSAKSVQKREAIVRAAIEVINAKSFALATMKDIAASLDLRDATLYHYFPDKQTLAYACHQYSFDRYERIFDIVNSTKGTGGEKLKRFIRKMFNDAAFNGPQLYLGDFSYLTAAQRKFVSVRSVQLMSVLTGFIREGIADASIKPCEPEVVVQLMLGMLIWLGKWVPTIPDMTVDRLMEAVDVFSFRGLEASVSVGSNA